MPPAVILNGVGQPLPPVTTCPLTFAASVPGTEGLSADSTPAFRHPDFLSGLKEKLDHGAQDVDTLWGLFERSAKLYPNADCHGKRTTDEQGNVVPGFTFTTYAQVYARIQRFASGLVNLDLMQPDVSGELRLLGLMGGNGSEWNVAELSCLSMSGTTVPFYTTSTPDTLAFMLKQNGCATMVCDVASARQLLKAKPDSPSLATLVVYGASSAVMDELRTAADEQTGGGGVKLLTYEQVEESGKASPQEFQPPKGDQVFSFIYTSGSTGMPKAALLTHQGQVSVIAGTFVTIERCGIVFKTAGERHLSYLPSAHVMERAFSYQILLHGGAIGYFQGKRELLIEDLASLHPTCFPIVPRLMSMIRTKILTQVQSMSGLKRAIFNMALNAKLANLPSGQLRHALWDALVFKAVKAKLGLDQCNYIVTGSAPVSGTVLDFFRAAFGVMVVEGLGMSETAASASSTHPLFFSSEHVGGPSPNVELKLVSVPELGYLVTDKDHKGMAVQARGEICVRGRCVMKGYYLNPEATAKALDQDGWYHTGDVGCLLPNGCFKIFDRISNVFKLSIGEFIAPERVENIMNRSPFVGSLFCHGDGLHKHLVAVVVVDEDAAKRWWKEHGTGKGGDDGEQVKLSELVKNADLRQAVLKDFDQVGRQFGLLSYEIPKDVFLEHELWSPDNILTATQKLQRKKAVARYSQQLEAMLADAA